MLSPPTITFELHAKMVEETDVENCNFCKFASSVTLTLTLDRVEVIWVGIPGRGLPTHQIWLKSEKTFCGRTDGRTNLSCNLLGPCNRLRDPDHSLTGGVCYLLGSTYYAQRVCTIWRLQFEFHMCPRHEGRPKI